MTRAILPDNGLTIAPMAMIVFCLGGRVGSGWIEENLTLQAHGAPSESLLGYVFSPSFQWALFENWESEFLQMSA